MNSPLDLKEVKCRINEGCFFALGSYARFKLEKVVQENDAGTDFRLIKQIIRNGKVCDMGGVLEFQLKCTVDWTDEGDFIKYSLRSKNYNDIISRNQENVMPLILILMCLPKDDIPWVDCAIDEVRFRRNLFWYHTNSLEFLANEDSTRTIQIPKENQLTPTTFVELVQKYAVRAIIGE